jgi:hypothetical protein
MRISDVREGMSGLFLPTRKRRSLGGGLGAAAMGVEPAAAFGAGVAGTAATMLPKLAQALYHSRLGQAYLGNQAAAGSRPTWTAP